MLSVVPPPFLRARLFPWTRNRVGNVPVEPTTDFDEIMTSGLCAVCSHRRVAPAGGLLEHRAGCSRAALRNVPYHPSRLTSLSSHLHPEEVFSVGAELHRPLCILHPEHILQDESCGCGFEEAKRFARDKRICFTAMRRQAKSEDRRGMRFE